MTEILGTDLIKDSRAVINANFAELDSLATVAFSATPVFDLALGRTQVLTLTGNVTASTMLNQAPGVTYTFLIKQDATGERAFVWPAAFRGAMEVGAAVNAGSLQQFLSDGTLLWAKSPGVINV